MIRSLIGDSSGNTKSFDIGLSEAALPSQQATKEGFRKTDVFLKPFEEGICVEDDFTSTHTLILNKFPIKQNHVLVITKASEKQSDLLTVKDFEAVCIAMKSLDEAFAFFNSGKKAGASQDHKHVQVIELKQMPGQKIPIDEVVLKAMEKGDHHNHATGIFGLG